MFKGFNRSNVTILVVLLILYFGVNLYYNYKAQSLSAVPEADAEALKSCSMNEIDGNRLLLTIPSTYVNGATQENLDAVAEAAGYEKITLNSDGSATYTLTHEQHEKMMKDLHTGISDKLIMLPGSKSFKDIDSIKANEDFTEYTVTLNTIGANFDSSMIAMNLKMFSTMYNCFQGVTDEIIHIEFYNKNGDKIADFNSGVTE